MSTISSDALDACMRSLRDECRNGPLAPVFAPDDVHARFQLAADLGMTPEAYLSLAAFIVAVEEAYREKCLTP